MGCMACGGHDKMPHTCVPPSDAKHECVSSPAELKVWEDRRRDTGAAERRKYALLASATQFYCQDSWMAEDAVDAAETLLAEIERRERDVNAQK